MTLQRDAQNKIQIELDTKIKEHLAQYGEDRGWTLEETIRYILGKYDLEYTAVVPMMSSRGVLDSSTVTRSGKRSGKLDR